MGGVTDRAQSESSSWDGVAVAVGSEDAVGNAGAAGHGQASDAFSGWCASEDIPLKF